MNCCEKLSDADLMAVLDGAPDAQEVRARVSTCAECQRRLAELESAAAFVGGLLAQDAEPFEGSAVEALPGASPRPPATAPAASNNRRWIPMLIAASLVLLFVARGPLVAFVNSWRSFEGAPVVPATPAPVHSYRFAVEETLVVDFPGSAPASFRVVADASTRASLRLIGAGSDDEVTVDDGRVEISLSAPQEVEVQLTIPSGVVDLTMRAAGETLRPEWSPSATAVPREWLVGETR